MLKVTVYDKFHNLEMTGSFYSEEDAREFYAEQLDESPEDVNIVKVEEMEMRTWARRNYYVEEVEYDYNLHKFHVTQYGKFVVDIVPEDQEQFDSIAQALDSGLEIEGWDNGLGQQIHIEPLYYAEIVEYENGDDIKSSLMVVKMRDLDEIKAYAENLAKEQEKGYGVIVNEWTTDYAVEWVAEYRA